MKHTLALISILSLAMSSNAAIAQTTQAEAGVRIHSGQSGRLILSRERFAETAQVASSRLDRKLSRKRVEGATESRGELKGQQFELVLLEQY